MNNNMNNNNLAIIQKTRSLIAMGDIVGAENALAELADAEGDRALALVLAQLPPKDVLAVIREFDSSRESVVNLVVTPEMFARAVVIEKQYKDLTHTHLRGMMNSVIFRDDADPIEFLTAISELEGGAEAMANYFAEKWSRIEAFARTGSFDAVDDYGDILSEDELHACAYVRAKLEHDEVADQDWMEMAWFMRYECPDLFIETILVLRAKARAHQLGLEEEEDEYDDPTPKVPAHHVGKFDTRETDRGRATPAAREAEPDDEDEESAI